MTPSQRNDAAAIKLLLVEGNDDLRFFQAMSRHWGITDVAVSSYNGKPNLGNDLSARVRGPGFQTVSSLGIVREADDSSRSAFDSVVGSLRRARLPTPDVPIAPIERDGLRISVLILPPDYEQGELENVCLEFIEISQEMQCVENYLTCQNSLELGIASSQIAKARLHSYLAAGPIYASEGGQLDRRRPALRLGEAADAGVWDWASPAFAKIVSFLRSL